MSGYRSWNHVLAAVDPLAKSVGKFTSYQLDPYEKVGEEYFHDVADAADYLRRQGYERNALAAAKQHPAPHSALDHGSYRRVPDDHPFPDTPGNGIPRIVREYDPVQCQYHVHLWPVADGIEFFSHYEVRPDLRPVGDESLTDAYRRAREHYRPDEETYIRGISDLEI